MGCLQSTSKNNSKIINDRQLPYSVKQQLATVSSKVNIRKVYNFVKILGTGGFSQVKLGNLKSDNSIQFAIKIIEKSRLGDKLYMLLREFQILKTLDHPNIIKFHEVYEDDKFFYIVQEFCSGGELLQRIIKQQYYEEQPAAILMKKLIGAVIHMHSNHVVHRDLKPENILFVDKSPDAELKIIDFGLSTKFQDHVHIKTMVGTPLYVSPQILKGRYSEKCDIWSLGVIMYILLCGCPPFFGETKDEIFDQIEKQNNNIFQDKFWQNISQEAIDLITKMLTSDEKKRITLENALLHPWFKLIQKSQIAKKQEMKQRPKILNRLKNFKGQSLFKKEVMSVFINQLNEKDIHKLKAVFQEIDKDNSGMIDIQELNAAMKQCNIEIDKDDIKSIFDQLCEEEINGQKIVKYSKFIAATLNIRKHLTEEKMWSLFKYFDQSGANCITVQGLQEIMKRHGQQQSEEQIKKMILEVDPSHDGMISFETFKKILMDGEVAGNLDIKN